MRRGLWVWLHRWIGLGASAFLIVIALTGSLLSFHDELNHWLAPRLFPGPHAGKELDLAALVRRAEAIAPQARATRVYVGYRGTAVVSMEPRSADAPLDFDRIYLDAVSGAELGRLKWGAAPTSLAGVMPFIYALHYKLVAGDIGEWIVGIVALAWTLDCFIAFYLTLPSSVDRTRKSYLARWKAAWTIKRRASPYRITFDVHRAAGLWLWAMLFMFAWSGVGFNMNGAYSRITNLFVDYAQPAWALPALPEEAQPPKWLEWEDALAVGQRLMSEQAQAIGFNVERPLALYRLRDRALYEYRVRSSLDIGDKAGGTSVFFDITTGDFKGFAAPTGQRAGNTITTWLFELHMANLFGLPYKIFICLLGLIITMLSVTGVYIWWKKRAARRSHRLRESAAPTPIEATS